MSQWFLLSISLGYLLLLFALAYWGESRAKMGKSVINNAYVYVFSLTIYCTAWTYFGSVGRALESGIDFLAIYIGPTLGMPLWWFVMRKITKICRSRHITSIADFISSRYGNSRFLGLLVSLVSIIGVIPYIALQLEAVSSGFSVLSHQKSDLIFVSETSLYYDTAFVIMLILAVFTILFGTRHIEATERHEGMVTAIAFESLIKLLAFLILGIYVVYFVYEGFDDIIAQARQIPSLDHVFTLNPQGGYMQWFSLCVLSMLAFMFLPRQFQIAVIENVNPAHLKKAVWLFPLYLLLINIFVLPIALAGELLLKHQHPADTYVLALPLYLGQDLLAVLVYLGGFSAAGSMIVVSTTALTVMMSNNMIMPLLVSIPSLKKSYTVQLGRILLYIRRICIILILHLAYLFDELFIKDNPLVSIGLISFVAIAQFAPAMLGGIYWRNGNRYGTTCGILLGMGIWFYTLIIPLFVSEGFLPQDIVEQGLWGLFWLKPGALFGLSDLDPISHAMFWSLLFNIAAYVGLSFGIEQDANDANQAEIFVNIHRYAQEDGVIYWQAKARIQDLEFILNDFLGKERTQLALKEYSQIYGVQWRNSTQADANFIVFCEKLLAGTIGVSAARTMMNSVVSQNEEIRIEEVLHILKESQELIALNKALEEKSEALEQATGELQQVNENLQDLDQRKNEFISTVTHELRTPITSIRAFSEILYDNDDIELDEKKHFLNTIIKETHRTERLINQVLELERLESGTETLHIHSLDLNEIIRDALDTFKQVIRERQMNILLKLTDNLPPILGDRDKLMQVFINLLSNAVKFCNKETCIIEIHSELVQSQIRVSVMDNGRGIKKELHQLIFEKFFQAKDQHIRKPKGSGLGLAICKKILQSHKGDIFVESEEGEYTKMLVILPIQPSEELEI
ncbi:MAG: sensor histidine kinase [Microscillaceae bacterium]|nr:sensor histidine kinase [Microscillaceae bacterium]